MTKINIDADINNADCDRNMFVTDCSETEPTAKTYSIDTLTRIINELGCSASA